MTFPTRNSLSRFPFAPPPKRVPHISLLEMWVRRLPNPTTFFPSSKALCFLLLAAITLSAHAADLSSAERQLNRGEADHAIASLRATLAAEPHNGAAHLLLCRTLYAYQQLDPAVSACEAAAAELNSATAYDWLGRAYGRKAEQYGPISGLAYARRVRDAFETAHRLDPRDGPSANDLSEFYINAPTVIGGGPDRARALAAASAAALPQNAHRMRAMAAEKAGDNAAAEREFRAAVSVAGLPGAWNDLADFYARRNNPGATLDALNHAFAAAHLPGPWLVDSADILISLKVHPELSERWLRAYLAGNAQTDEAPAFRVRTELAHLLLARGDKAAARVELDQALALASNYAPAKKALNSL
jgi:tetratricopeptide (TPR) repeat protein